MNSAMAGLLPPALSPNILASLWGLPRNAAGLPGGGYVRSYKGRNATSSPGGCLRSQLRNAGCSLPNAAGLPGGYLRSPLRNAGCPLPNAAGLPEGSLRSPLRQRRLPVSECRPACPADPYVRS